MLSVPVQVIAWRTVSEMTCNVSSGTLNLTHSPSQHVESDCSLCAQRVWSQQHSSTGHHRRPEASHVYVRRILLNNSNERRTVTMSIMRLFLKCAIFLLSIYWICLY